MRLYIDDKASSIEEICSLLKISKTDIPFHIKQRHFNRLGFDKKKDPQNNKPIVPRGHGIPCSINAYLPSGDVVKITYAENSRQISRNGMSMIKHTPITIMLPGLTLSLTEDQKNKFFFLYIHGYNKQSPLNVGKLNPACVYEFFDTEKTAKEENDKEEILMDALLALRALGENEVRQVAKGYKMLGIDDLTEPEVRRRLRVEKLNVNPAQFIINLNDNEIALEGIIQDAMDRGVITERTVGTSKVWILGDKELSVSPLGSNPIVGIRAEIETNLDLYFPLLQGSLKDQAKASHLKKPENDRFFSSFKNKSEDTITPLSPEDKQSIAKSRAEAAEVEKLRAWYIDVNDPSIHTNTKKAVIANGDRILTQFAKDLAEGFLPEGTTEPVVKLKED